jgi:hypothetical protein
MRLKQKKCSFKKSSSIAWDFVQGLNKIVQQNYSFLMNDAKWLRISHPHETIWYLKQFESWNNLGLEKIWLLHTHTQTHTHKQANTKESLLTGNSTEGEGQCKHSSIYGQFVVTKKIKCC